MSQKPNSSPAVPPKTERWVVVMAAAFVPVVAALFLPESARIALVAIGGLTFVTGFVLMFRASRRSRGGESLRQLLHAERE